MEIKNNVLIKVTDDDIEYGTITIPNNVNYIGNEAFKNCKFLKHITIPKNVNGIGYSAFENCVNLKSISMSDEIETIGNNAFRNCTSLINVMIPKNVKVIEVGTFCNCKSLKNINIMGDLEKIKEHAFRDCKGLKKLFIPKSIKYINASAFYGCSKLNLNIETSLFSFDVGAYYEDIITFKKLHIYNDCITHKQALVYYDDFGMKCLRTSIGFYDYIITFLNSVRKSELYKIIQIKLTHNMIISKLYDNLENIKYLKYKEHESFIDDLLRKGIMQFDYMKEIDDYVNKYIKACVRVPKSPIEDRTLNNNMLKSIYNTYQGVEILDKVDSDNTGDTTCDVEEVIAEQKIQSSNNYQKIFELLSKLPFDELSLIRDMVKNDFFDENIEKYIYMSREEKIEFLNAKSQKINKEKGDLLKNESQESGKPKVSLKKEPIEVYKERQKQLKK